jgi:hypothetical protein
MSCTRREMVRGRFGQRSACQWSGIKTYPHRRKPNQRRDSSKLARIEASSTSPRAGSERGLAVATSRCDLLDALLASSAHNEHRFNETSISNW